MLIHDAAEVRVTMSISAQFQCIQVVVMDEQGQRCTLTELYQRKKKKDASKTKKRIYQLVLTVYQSSVEKKLSVLIPKMLYEDFVIVDVTVVIELCQSETDRHLKDIVFFFFSLQQTQNTWKAICQTFNGTDVIRLTFEISNVYIQAVKPRSC